MLSKKVSSETTWVAILIAILISGCAHVEMDPFYQTEVDGNAISYVTNFGEGPTVVFESGLGNDLTVWADVYAEAQRFVRVFAYSRPGYSDGHSQIKHGDVRTADQSAALLRKLLDQLNVPTPYILVGHSIGGMYALEFARAYPEVVAGLVLVDARLPGFTKKCELAQVGPCRPEGLVAAVSSAHVSAEIRGISASETSAPLPAELGDMPVTLIAATRPPRGLNRAAQDIWLGVQENYADALENGVLVRAEGTGHFIQREAPELVIEAIRHLVALTKPVDYWMEGLCFQSEAGMSNRC